MSYDNCPECGDENMTLRTDFDSEIITCQSCGWRENKSVDGL
jgi:transcription elongation factor Elf1